MNNRASVWKTINEPIKHLFDSLRNLGIAGAVMVAAKYIEHNSTLAWGKDHARFVEYCGYFLVILASVHFAIGTWALLPNGRDFIKGGWRNPYTIQILLIGAYVMILGALMAQVMTK